VTLLACGCGNGAPGAADEGAPIEAAEPAVAAEGTVAPAVAADALEVGGRYVFAPSTPLVRDLDPGDPAMAMAETTLLADSATLLVVERIETAGTVWYRVQAEIGEGAAGWVSLQALDGRAISRAP
jgi:hypothetical protein